jgi:hypothetical protein
MEEIALRSSMSTSIVADEEPLLSIRLEYMAGEGEGHLALAEQAIMAINALAGGWLEPLAWEMYVGCLDIELMHATMEQDPPQPFWLLRKERIPAGIELRPGYGNHTIVTEPTLSSERIQAWVSRALAQPCADAPRFIPYWDGFDTLAMRARLPASVANTADESLGMRCYAGNIAIPLERHDDQVWVSGPPEKYLIGPPVSLSAGNMDGHYINLDLAIYWTPWIRDPAGRAMVDAAVDRVLALGRGWQRSED